MAAAAACLRGAASVVGKPSRTRQIVTLNTYQSNTIRHWNRLTICDARPFASVARGLAGFSTGGARLSAPSSSSSGASSSAAGDDHHSTSSSSSSSSSPHGVATDTKHGGGGGDGHGHGALAAQGHRAEHHDHDHHHAEPTIVYDYGNKYLTVSRRGWNRWMELDRFCPYIMFKRWRGEAWGEFELLHDQLRTQQHVDQYTDFLPRDEIRNRLYRTLNYIEKVDKSKISEEADFIQDLGLDSLDSVEVVMMIEDEFDFRIPDEVLTQLNTVRDCIDYIASTPYLLSETPH